MQFNPRILPKNYQAVFKEEFTREELEQHIINEMMAQPEIHEFLQRFEQASHKNFIERYAKVKTEVLLDLTSLRDTVQDIHNDFTELASEHLWNIQQKKLFDMQCQWRAEEIKIPGVQCTTDFLYWEQEIKLCPFLTPISQQEFDLYVKFLTTSEVSLNGLNSHQWQDYTDFTANYRNENEGEPLPEWYAYHNLYSGNAKLLALPDIRGQKEEFYKAIWRKHNLPADAVQIKPFIYFHDDENRDLFLNTFENKQFIKNFTEYMSINAAQGALEEIDETVRFLLQWPDAIEISAHHDWRQALVETKERFILSKTLEALHTVYDEYKMKEDLQLPHQDKFDEQHHWYKTFSDLVLEGRKLNGEPADFNF